MSAFTLADKIQQAEPLPLFDAKPPRGDSSRPRGERAFRAFHKANPHVLVEAIDVARRLKATGIAQGSIDLVVEEMRRVHPVATSSDYGYRLNNNFAAYYARLVVHKAPDLAEWFVMRKQRVAFDPRGL